MISKELKRLSRRELVDIIYQLKKNEQEMQEEIEKSLKDADSAFYPTDRLFEMVTDVYEDAWELLYNPAAKIDLRVYLWAIGFYMACDQLGI